MIVVIVGRVEPRMDLGGDRRQQAVLRHRVEDPRLAHQHDQDHRAKAQDRADLDVERQPGHTHRVGRHGDGVGHVKLPEVDDSGQYDRPKEIEQRANDQRADDADWQVALGVLGLLGGRRHRVEADVGEEDHAGCSEDAAPTVLEVVPGAFRGLDERASPVLAIDQRQAENDQKNQDRDLDENDDVVDPSRFPDADTSKIVTRKTISMAGALNSAVTWG